MQYADTGQVLYHTLPSSTGGRVLVFTWQSNTVGVACRRCETEVEGVLEKFESVYRPGSGAPPATYALSFLDELGADWLNGLAASLDPNLVYGQAVYVTLGSARAREQRVMGRPTFRLVTDTTSRSGVVKLFLRPMG